MTSAGMVSLMENTETRPRRRILLIVSLCLNLFLIGVIAAGLYVARQRDGLGGGFANSPFNPRNLAAMLPPDGKDKVEAVVRENRRQFMPLVRDSRQTRLDAFRVLQQEPLDRTKAQAALDEVRRADARLAEDGQRVVLDILQKLTPQERAIVMEKIRNRDWKRQDAKPDDDF